MPAPDVIVTVSAALPRRGDPTATGTAVMAFTTGSTGTGPTAPVRCLSAADATTAYGSTGQAGILAGYVGDALALGAPEVITVRVQGAAAAPTAAEWAAGLARVSEDFGTSAQVAIPGVSGTAAHEALLAHAADFSSRAVFLDAASDATAAALTTITGLYDDNAAAPRAGLVAPWVQLPGPAETVRTVPGSVIALGLVGRGDAATGHANNAPAFDQGRGAGFIDGAIAPTAVFTPAEVNTLHDAGVSLIRDRRGIVQLYGWRSLSGDARFRGLGAGRMAGQLDTGFTVLGEQFLGRQIDGDGQIFGEFETVLEGYLEPLQAAGAIYGTARSPGYEVRVRQENTPTSIAAGQLRAAVEVTLTEATERVLISVVTNRVQGA